MTDPVKSATDQLVADGWRYGVGACIQIIANVAEREGDPTTVLHRLQIALREMSAEFKEGDL